MQYPGSKHRLAERILDLAHPHKSWVEPYCGSLSLLFGSSRSRAPVQLVNDLDGELVAFLRVLRDHTEPLVRALELTPYAQAEFDLAAEPVDSEDPVEQARRWYVRTNMTFVGSASSKGGAFTTTTKGSSSQSNATKWSRYVSRLPTAARQLIRSGIQVTNDDALAVIARVLGDPECILYCDPPYLPAVRRGVRYGHDVDAAHHEQMVDLLLRHRGQVLLSGYDHEMYERLTEQGWWRHDYTVMSSSSPRMQTERVEVVWSNRPAPQIPIVMNGWCAPKCRQAAWRARRSAARPLRTCERCGDQFVGRVDARFCGGACKQAAWRQRRPDR